MSCVHHRFSHRHTGITAFALALALLASASAAGAGVLRFEQSTVMVQPGASFSVLLLADDFTTPIFGYSVAVTGSTRANQTRQSMGSVSIDSVMTNFYDQRNLITAGGGTRDPFFSVIFALPPSGAFISTNADQLEGFLPEPGVNDVLAEVVFRVSADADGEFSFVFGPQTAFADVQGFAIPFTAEEIPLTVIVPSAPAAAAFGAAILLASRRRRAV